MIGWLFNLLGKLKKSEELENKVVQLEQENETIKAVNNISNLEELFNNKYPNVPVFYKKNVEGTEMKKDVRQFVNYHNNILPKFEGTDDEKALLALKWVIANIKYTPDKSTYKLNEYWQDSWETLVNKKGDCEDGAFLLYDILRNSGVPYWKLRLSTGYVWNNKKKVGHCYLTYYCEFTDCWVILDWCYSPTDLPVRSRAEYKNEKLYFETWFSFNELYSYVKDTKDLKKFEKSIQ